MLAQGTFLDLTLLLGFLLGEHPCKCRSRSTGGPQRLGSTLLGPLPYSFPPATPFHSLIFTLFNICSSIDWGQLLLSKRYCSFLNPLKPETSVLVPSILGKAICHLVSLIPGQQSSASERRGLALFINLGIFTNVSKPFF